MQGSMIRNAVYSPLMKNKMQAKVYKKYQEMTEPSNL